MSVASPVQATLPDCGGLRSLAARFQSVTLERDTWDGVGAVLEGGREMIRDSKWAQKCHITLIYLIV